MNEHLQDLLAWLDASPCAALATTQAVKRLAAKGFQPLNEKGKWSLEPGGKYYLVRDTGVIALVLGSQDLSQTGFRLAAAHLDSPTLKLKPASLKQDQGVTRATVEVYGGPILSTWLDRELGLAGRVAVRRESSTSIEIVDLERPVAVIPNAAIHLNREVNNGFVYNKQTHLQAYLCAGSTSSAPLREALAEKLGVTPERIGEMELYLYDFAKASLTGLDGNLVVSGRLDNLGMSHAVLSAVKSADRPAATCVGILYDHEEIGSSTPQGADSALLPEILERVCIARGLSREEHFMALRNSFLISADMAHAYHPSYPEKYDAGCSPVMNGGPVVKWNAGYKYATTAETGQRFGELCEAAGVPHQSFAIRSDLLCGSTVGPIISAQLGIPTVDVGNPLWAMHSIRETAGAQDHAFMIKALQEFYK